MKSLRTLLPAPQNRPKKAAFVIFAKLPVPGRVKTRLLSVLSPHGAAQLHNACLADTLMLAARHAQCSRHLYIAPPANLAAIERLPHAAAFDPRWQIRRQRGRHLGARLAAAVRELLASGAQRIVIVGTDTPWMAARRVAHAFRALRRADVVLGPAEDGGYYLIGVRRFVPQMFEGIPWGTHRVLRRTVAALEKSGVRFVQLPTDFDLDRPADLRRLERWHRAGKVLPPELDQWLTNREFERALRERKVRSTVSESSRRRLPPRRRRIPPPGRA